MSDEERPKVSWTSNKHIAELLNVSTAACTLCGAAARVPEDVIAVRQTGAKRVPVVICVECQPGYVQKFSEMLDTLQRKEQEEE